MIEMKAHVYLYKTNNQINKLRKSEAMPKKFYCDFQLVEPPQTIVN
jgi:hypothetical protein